MPWRALGLQRGRAAKPGLRKTRIQGITVSVPRKTGKKLKNPDSELQPEICFAMSFFVIFRVDQQDPAKDPQRWAATQNGWWFHSKLSGWTKHDPKDPEKSVAARSDVSDSIPNFEGSFRVADIKRNPNARFRTFPFIEQAVFGCVR